MAKKRLGELARKAAKRNFDMMLEMAQYENLGVLEGPYSPISKGKSVKVNVPDSMDYNSHSAVARIAAEVGDLDDYVMKKLHYKSKREMWGGDTDNGLGAEQVDAVAMAIYNIEVRKQGMIVGDQTGIGKGRIAAALVRYGYLHGYKPVFITEKPNLFSDLYRDLLAIGSEDLIPFIINADASKTRVTDSKGEVVHKPIRLEDQRKIFKGANDFDSPSLKKYDFFMCTYSQINASAQKPSIKQAFLANMARNNILIMDESHNASGNSNTGMFLRELVRNTMGVLFLSATFAKTPNNMPIYAMKTSISDANISSEALVEAITSGGVPLQEIISAQLVHEGQMVRRERTYDGVEVNYVPIEDNKDIDMATADAFTDVLRDVIKFQKEHVAPVVEFLDGVAVLEGEEVKATTGTNLAGVDNLPYYSRVFNVINQMLLAIKAKSIVKRALWRLSQDKKVVIAFSNTMGSFLEQQMEEQEVDLKNAPEIYADFSYVALRALTTVMKITKSNGYGDKTKRVLDVSELSHEGRQEYHRIVDKIKSISFNMTISPIDEVMNILESRGYRVAEVTGRKYKVDFPHLRTKRSLNGLGDIDKSVIATVSSRKKENVQDLFRKFNDHDIDVLLINQSGSTGASGHAIPTHKVTYDKIKQRVMIVLQPELDINTEMQKRGRVNRTGQKFKPIYDYLYSEIPAEKRLMMMLQKKLKSLDANTASNQKNSSDMMDVPDFLNEIGDEVVMKIMKDERDSGKNPDLNDILGDPLKLKKFESGTSNREGEGEEEVPDEVEMDEHGEIKDDETVDAATRVTGRVALLPCKDQEIFYQQVFELYNNKVAEMKAANTYNLETEILDLAAKTEKKFISKEGKGTGSVFSKPTYMEQCMVNNLRKPYTHDQALMMYNDEAYKNQVEGVDHGLIQEIKAYYQAELKKRLENLHQTIQKKRDKMTNTKAYLAAEKDSIKNEDPKILELFVERYNSVLDQEIESGESKITYKANITVSQLESFLNSFHRGMEVFVPLVSQEVDLEDDDMGSKIVYAYGVVRGIKVNRKLANPFTVSSINASIIVAHQHRNYVLFPDKQMAISNIKSATRTYSNELGKGLFHRWDENIKSQSNERVLAFIMTGNILQGFDQYKGNLVNYTTHDNRQKIGLLLTVDSAKKFMDETVKGKKLTIKLIDALPQIKSLIVGQNFGTNTKRISFIRQSYGFNFNVSGSKKDAGSIFLDKKILALTQSGFERVGGFMRAKIEVDKIDELVRILSDLHDVTVEIEGQKMSEVPVDEGEEFVEIPAPREELPEMVQSQPEQPKEMDLQTKIKVMKLKAVARMRLMEMEMAMA